MSDRDKQKKIIVKKVIHQAHGHHGGSWKVAYADFVTAMMALFLVLWVVNMNPQQKAGIEGYFKDPRGTMDKAGLGVLPGTPAATRPALMAPDMANLMAMVQKLEAEMYGESRDKMRQIVLSSPELQGYGAQIEISLTNEGLRIELVDAGGGRDFFRRGQALAEPVTEIALRLIANEVRSLPNGIVLEGHTDGSQYSTVAGYTNFELSSDRANAARRILHDAGVPFASIREVRGYGDQRPRVVDSPLAAANRRISLLVPYSQSPSELLAAERRIVRNALGDPIGLQRLRSDESAMGTAQPDGTPPTRQPR